MSHILMHAMEHTIIDSIKLLPFLLLTYILMEYVEHKTGGQTGVLLKKAGKVGPFLGGVAGLIPQCGISAAASNLYAGRMISIGTLLAVFLSTSDEMLPIMLSKSVGVSLIIKVLLLKLGIAVVAGFLVDICISFFEKGKSHELKIHDLCEHEHCRCEDGVFRSACRHTIHIFLYVLIITFVLNLGIEWIGEENLSQFILNQPFFGPILAAVIGLIPNCAASVVITEMFLEGLMSFGTMMAGLLVGAGVGIMVLLRVNEDKKDSFKIIGLLYIIGVMAGVVLNCLI